MRQIGLKQDVRERTYNRFTGQQLTQEDFPLADSEWLNLGQGSAALVYDTSIPGITSRSAAAGRGWSSRKAPERFALGLLADFRTYFMPKQPFTLRFAAFTAATGATPTNGVCRRCSLAIRAWCAGYDQGSFQAGECGIQADGSVRSSIG